MRRLLGLCYFGVSPAFAGQWFTSPALPSQTSTHHTTPPQTLYPCGFQATSHHHALPSSYAVFSATHPSKGVVLLSLSPSLSVRHPPRLGRLFFKCPTLICLIHSGTTRTYIFPSILTIHSPLSSSITHSAAPVSHRWCINSLKSFRSQSINEG